MKRLALPMLVLALASLAACETPTVFQEATRPNAVGFSEQRIEPGRYRVSFQGGGGAPAQQVEDYTLLRAAQIAVRDGYDWFRVIDRSGYSAPPRSGSSLSIGGGSDSFGRGGGIGLGLGTTFDLSGGPAVMRSFEILAGHGPTPPGPDAYDARGVIQTIGPRAAPPPPPPR